ncbi:MAG TPA: response regulator [Desulfomonilaceae bacterium]|nr:response regulator [Desulfomonilaceae bacterium]
MDQARPKRVPWKSWNDFTGWAQDFSLRKKVLGGFVGVVVLVGLLTSLIGTRLARDTIIERAKVRLHSDLATAGYILRNSQENLELKVRLTAGSDKIKEAIDKKDFDALRNRLALVALENDLDFLSVTDDKGRILARAFIPQSRGGDVASDSIVDAALRGKDSSGVRIIPLERLSQENPSLLQRLSEKNTESVMVMEAAHPLTFDSKVGAVLYGGILVNSNNLIVDRISRRLFRGELYGKKEVGFVTIYQGDKAITSTLRGKDAMPLVGFQADEQIRSGVLEKGQSEVTWETQLDTAYLSAAEPIRDADSKIVGAIQVATLEQPITSVIDRLVATFLVVGLFGVLLMAAISYFLVKWINRPLEQMVNSARRAAEGDLSHQVPVMARDEIGQLAATFNLMIRNLAESRNKLEEWGKQLASKVAEQTGELDQAREQVARVKKLASLEKMADGMAHIMAHISDPFLGIGPEDETGATSRILVLDTDEKVLEICQRIFESEGFEVTVTSSVNQALDELEQHIVDVVVADIDTPEMSGKELLKEIKSRQPDCLVIMTAPFKATEDAIEAVKLGAYDYIPKPFGPHQILLMVYTALQTRQMLKKTRQQHAQQRAETIFQRLPVAIALADDAHRVVYHNKAFIELASQDGEEAVQGKSFRQLFGVDPLDKKTDEESGSRWLELEKVGRTAKLYNFQLPDEDLRVLMLLDITETVMKDQKADVFKAETISKAQQVIHQQMRVAQEIAGLLGETTAETKAALFELIKLAGEGESR